MSLKFKLSEFDDEPIFVFKYKRSSGEKIKLKIRNPENIQDNDWAVFIASAASGNRGSIYFDHEGDVRVRCRQKIIKFEVVSMYSGWLSCKIPLEKCVQALTEAWMARRTLETREDITTTCI